MLPTSPESLLPLVHEAMSNQPDPRARALIGGLVEHLHRFVLEHRVTEPEFEYALDYIVRIGQATGPAKNEAVLVADLLGVSSLVALLNNANPQGASDAALLGPFWRANAPWKQPGDSIAAPGTPGMPLEARGVVEDVAGQPIGGAVVDVWQASPAGLYENQDEGQPDMNLRGRFETDSAGRFHFRSVQPAGYPVPVDGPGGDLLRAQGRQPYRPAHIHLMVSKPGYKVLVTQVFADDSEHLKTDPTFGVTERLVGRFEVADGPSGPVASLAHRLTLIRGETVFPKPPIP
jgi:catechol 1,2-dioxygenase